MFVQGGLQVSNNTQKQTIYSESKQGFSTLREKIAIESKGKCVTTTKHKKHIKNLSNEQLTDEQITLLCPGLKFIPTHPCLHL